MAFLTSHEDLNVDYSQPVGTVHRIIPVLPVSLPVVAYSVSHIALY